MLLTSYLFLVAHQANSDLGGKTFGGVWKTDEINKTRLNTEEGVGIQRLYLSPIPLNILILDDQNEDLKSVIDQDKYTVHVGPLDEHYVSKCQKF